MIGNMEIHREPVPSAHADLAYDVATYEVTASPNMQTNAEITEYQRS